ncbi:T6SS effector BTH_I2691 family protein [Pseudomonas lactis]|uniref:T6SS effector BTH_I2691 family protein n=1 Tax=Pseudomonas lactis TaxID=1615674 RepID=UPI00064559B0|nr:T6SS effector BTH_I2691 family protein [Pseudomonas lactis]
MTDTNDLLNFIARQTYSNEDASPSVSCKRTVSILPLRYAMIGNSQSESAQTTAFIPASASIFASLPSLTTARYVIRALRDGYLYVFIDRTETGWVCEGAYQTYSSGLCKALWPSPPDGLTVSNVPDFGDRVIQLSEPEDINEARLLFTPDPLTPRMLAQIREQQSLRESLRKVDVRQLIQSCSNTDHIIEAPALESTVADIVAKTSDSLSANLAKQLFAPPTGFVPLVGVATRLEATATQAQGFAVILDDPIGITQELNAWRNLSVESLETFMRKADDEGIDNKRKHTIGFAIENLKVTLAEQAEQRYVNHANSLGVRYTDREYATSNFHMVTASSGSYRSFRNPAEQRRQEQQDIQKARRDSWEKDYASSVDEVQLQAFMAEFQVAVKLADEIKDRRAEDHLHWLKSSALQEAYSYYDRRDCSNGLLFEAQIGVSVAGMNCTEKGDSLLETWSNADSVTPENWLWRGLAQNQTAAIRQINLVLAQRSQIPNIDGSQLQSLIKPLADIFDKSNALVSEANRNTSATPIRVSGAVLMINTFGTRMLQSGMASTLDRPTNSALALVFKARLGKLGEHLHFESRGTPLSQGVKAKIGLATSKAFSDSLAAGSTSPILEIRLGTTLALLEVWNLKLKAEKADKGSREYLELIAAMLAVSAAGLELGGVAVELAERSANPAVSQAGRLIGSKLKLMAGVLAAGAALAGMYFDLADAKKALGRSNYSLATVYLVRASAQVSAAFFSGAIGIAAAAPYLQRLIQTHGQKNFLKVAVKISSQLEIKMLFMLSWCFRINVIIFAASIALEILTPNELQHYLRHSTFRKKRGTLNGTPKTEEEELTNLRKAIEATL